MKSRPKPVIRYAKKRDIEALYPDASQTFRAIAVEIDGRTLGIGGVYYSGNVLVAFVRIEPELNLYPVTIWRASKRFIGLIGGRHCIAFADEQKPNAVKFLERLGFQHVEGNKYQWMN